MRDEYILAIDSFKGCMTSAQVEAAAEEALASRGAGAFCVPVSDGGEGMLDAFTSALGGTKAAALVHDPLMRPVEAQYGVCPGGTAIIETSKACGLTLVDERERDPLAASTYGVGELVAAAVEGGCRRFIIGLGGSGTSDCGRGMLAAGFAVVGGVTPDGQSLMEAMRPEVARANIVRWVRSHAD